MTHEEAKALVAEVLAEERGHGHALKVYGRASKKMIGEMVADALMHSPVVTIDGSKLTAIAGRRPAWIDRP